MRLAALSFGVAGIALCGILATPFPGSRGQVRLEFKSRGRTDAKADTRRRTEAAVRRALDWLALQNEGTRDGSYLLGGTDKPAPIAVTALATMAFLAHGECEGRGRYGRVVARGINYLLTGRQLHAPGEPNDGYFRTGNDKHSKTHGHGYATLCLSQAYGMVGMNRSTLIADREAVKRALVRAVRFIERIQGPTGGWYYHDYRDPVSHEGSVTICMVQALRGARNAGIKINHETVKAAERYVRQSQKPNGSFRYMLGSEQARPAIFAAALATLNMLGRYDDPALQRGLRWLRTKERDIVMMRRMHDEKSLEFPHYERLYIAQAYWQSRTLADWKRWYPKERDYLLDGQERDGSWKNSGYGAVYATAMNCLVLLMDYNYLPIFQR